MFKGLFFFPDGVLKILDFLRNLPYAYVRFLCFCLLVLCRKQQKSAKTQEIFVFYRRAISGQKNTPLFYIIGEIFFGGPKLSHFDIISTVMKQKNT